MDHYIKKIYNLKIIIVRIHIIKHFFNLEFIIQNLRKLQTVKDFILFNFKICRNVTSHVLKKRFFIFNVLSREIDYNE